MVKERSAPRQPGGEPRVWTRARPAPLGRQMRTSGTLAAAGPSRRANLTPAEASGGRHPDVLALAHTNRTPPLGSHQRFPGGRVEVRGEHLHPQLAREGDRTERRLDGLAYVQRRKFIARDLVFRCYLFWAVWGSIRLSGWRRRVFFCRVGFSLPPSRLAPIRRSRALSRAPFAPARPVLSPVCAPSRP